MVVVRRPRARVDEAARAAGGDAEGLLATGGEAADCEEDGDGDEGDCSREDDVEPDVEVGALSDSTNLEVERVYEEREGGDNVDEGEAGSKEK